MASMTDDYGTTSATAGSISIGTPATGNIDYYRDRDWFKIVLEARATYKIWIKGDAASQWATTWLPVSLSVIDPIFSMDYNLSAYATNPYGSEPVVRVKAERGGEYFIELNSSYPGRYSLYAELIGRDDYSSIGSKDSPVLAVGGQRSGSIELANDSDSFQVQLEGGKTYYFEGAGVVGSTGVAAVPSLYVYATGGDSQGYPVAGYPTNFYAPTTGTYYVSVSEALSSTGDYIVKAKLADDDYLGGVTATTALAIGSSVNAKIELPNDQDWFKVSLSANVSYTFLLRDASDKTQVTLRDSAGVWAGVYDSEVPGVGRMITWTPAQSGDYFLAIAGKYGVASYSLQASITAADDYSADAMTKGVLSGAGTIKGNLEVARDTDWIKVSTVAGTTYQFDLSKALLSTGKSELLYGFKLVNAVGTLVTEAIHGGDGNSTTLMYQAKTTGVNYLVVEGPYNVAMASYSITAKTTTADKISGGLDTNASIIAGQVITSAIDFGTDKDWFKLDTVAGERYEVGLSGVTGEGGTLVFPSIKLYDAAGQYVYVQSYAYGDSGFSFTAPKAGSYFIEVRTQDRETGTYTLKAGNTTTPMPDTVGPHLYSFSPPRAIDGASSDLSITFDEAVLPRSGFIKLSLANGQLVESFNIVDSPLIKLEYSYMTINPATNWLPGTDYVLQFPANVVTDKAGNPLTTTITRSFHTVDGPTNRIGTDGNDTFRAGSGPDTINGGAGVDKVIIDGRWNDYQISRGPESTTVKSYGNYNIDVLTSVERIEFTGMAVAYDLKGAAGQLYRVYQAAFNRTPDYAGLGYWLSRVDTGFSLRDSAREFIASNEFTKMYGAAPSNDVYINKLYENVLHRPADQGGLDYWNQVMHNGLGKEDVLLQFSESNENQLAVSGSIQSGIWFTPFL